MMKNSVEAKEKESNRRGWAGSAEEQMGINRVTG